MSKRRRTRAYHIHCQRRHSRRSRRKGSNKLIIWILASLIILGIAAIGFGVSTILATNDEPKEVTDVQQNLLSENTTELPETVPVTVPVTVPSQTTFEPQETLESMEETEPPATESEVQEEPEETPELPTESETVEEPSEPKTIIYLTFDDGPSIQSTEKILDILKEKGIQATFFILDYDFGSTKEELLKREFEEGHTIGLHGTSHQYSSIYSSLDTLYQNFTTLQEKVFTSLGIETNFIRFPGGTSNTVSRKYCPGIMTEAIQYFPENGYEFFDWNVDSGDAGSASSAEEVYNNVINTLIIGHTNVVLMHDSAGKQHTIGALPDIIDYCLEHGYEFRAIDSDTPFIRHPSNN